MLKWLKIIIGTLRSSVRSRHELALENLAVPPIYSASLTVLPLSGLPHFCHSANVIQRVCGEFLFFA